MQKNGLGGGIGADSNSQKTARPRNRRIPINLEFGNFQKNRRLHFAVLTCWASEISKLLTSGK
jgi:hypothetical protein